VQPWDDGQSRARIGGGADFMRIMTWNIRHGGGQRVDRIIEAVCEVAPDLLVLTEFRNGATGERLRQRLLRSGWPHHVMSSVSARTNGVLVASRRPVRARPIPTDRAEWKERIVEGRIGPLDVIAAYFPIGRPKAAFFKWFLEMVRARADSRTLLVGDFNTGRHFEDEAGATFWASEYMDELKVAGFTDAWRHLHPRTRDYTWFSAKGNGFRLDYVFLGQALLPSLRVARHVHAVRERGDSDHAALVVDLD
jgi:exodeoxyribonuclease-3